MKILYEDNHIIVAVKPQNMPTQSDSSGDEDFLSAVREYVRVAYNKPGNVFLGLVHRLDRPVGGVMVFARTSKAAARLFDQLKDGRFQKSYYAVVNSPIDNENTLCDYLLKNPKKNMSAVVSKNTSGAKYAELSYVKKSEIQDYSLVKINLKTGRSHQIRVQFKNIGAPLVGDKKYGGADSQNICLFAHSISIDHPTKKERMTFYCEPPKNHPWNLFSF